MAPARRRAPPRRRRCECDRPRMVIMSLSTPLSDAAMLSFRACSTCGLPRNSDRRSSGSFTSRNSRPPKIFTSCCVVVGVKLDVEVRVVSVVVDVVETVVVVAVTVVSVVVLVVMVVVVVTVDAVVVAVVELVLPSLVMVVTVVVLVLVLVMVVATVVVMVVEVLVAVSHWENTPPMNLPLRPLKVTEVPDAKYLPYSSADVGEVVPSRCMLPLDHGTQPFASNWMPAS
mmetsp:Transcript_33848/g.86735  ORF Transcript_33848/g.86735 Transcript_33848/m.86735 type:complete len:229 (+) Transcript_33848:1279-1965(+)